jgi:hypothetical protein
MAKSTSPITAVFNLRAVTADCARQMPRTSGWTCGHIQWHALRLKRFFTSIPPTAYSRHFTSQTSSPVYQFRHIEPQAVGVTISPKIGALSGALVVCEWLLGPAAQAAAPVQLTGTQLKAAR